MQIGQGCEDWEECHVQQYTLDNVNTQSGNLHSLGVVLCVDMRQRFIEHYTFMSVWLNKAETHTGVF